MSEPVAVKMLEIDLAHPTGDVHGLAGYGTIKVLIKISGVPVGYVALPVNGDTCAGKLLRKAALAKHWYSILQNLVFNALMKGRGQELEVNSILEASLPGSGDEQPLVTVAVCTRNRPGDLARCLEAIDKLEYENLDVVVVDNAPSADVVEICGKYPKCRYHAEPRPGLDWARNRAIIEAQGEIVAFTDDDAVVDPKWVDALVNVFQNDKSVMAVTGLVVPYELETSAQVLFEAYGGFGRGFARRWHSLDRTSKALWQAYGTGQYGTGANMAFRRSAFEEIGYFDPALDVGTMTNGGGDLEIFYRLLQAGLVLVYEPRAIVRHRHRRDYVQLKDQITNNGVGFYSYLVRSADAYPMERKALLKLGVWWFWRNGSRLLKSYVRKNDIPRGLIAGELVGSVRGLRRYRKARDEASRIALRFGGELPRANPAAGGERRQRELGTAAIRSVNLEQIPQGIEDVEDYGSVRVFLMRDGCPLGQFDIVNNGVPISSIRLVDAIVDQLPKLLPKLLPREGKETIWADVRAALSSHYLGCETEKSPGDRPALPPDLPVSIVLATYDRPKDLANCLRLLLTQETRRPVEIVVVDNNPSSGLTPPVVAEFPGVKLVSESRSGLAYARNAGIAASVGDIIVATDDDVSVTPKWLETLVAPFARPEVMAVTGNTLPLEMETPSQRLFETYGGLGRGFEPFEVDSEWFYRFRRHSVPTWTLGATANAAFRRSIFSDKNIGMFPEELGPGTPAGGCGEDTYVFYKILKRGYTLVYEPRAFVWHRHRTDMSALRRQLYHYSKGHVAYHLMTFLRDGDLRGLKRVCVSLPAGQLWRLWKSIRGKKDYPASLVLLEIRGNLAGPVALFRSMMRVRRLGRVGVNSGTAYSFGAGATG